MSRRSPTKENTSINLKILALVVIMVMLGAAMAGCLSKTEKKNKPPTAEISEVSSEGQDGVVFNIGDEIFFSANGSSDPEKKTLTYEWDFGDDGNASTMNATHVYSKAGIFNVTLTVNDGKKSDTSNIFLDINTPPVAVINLTNNMLPVNVSITFDGSDSYDDDGDTLQYTWDFGNNNTTSGMMVNYTFIELGYYNVTLTVKDDVTSAIETKAVQVFQPNRPPVAAFLIQPSTINNTEAITFNATTSIDLDGDVLTYAWDFGDGITSTGDITTHTFELAGSYIVNLTVDDGEFNNKTSKILGVLQKNRAPVAAFNISKDTGYIGLEINFDASASVDPDDDELNYTWDFGDGTNGTGADVIHAYTNVGIFTVNLTVSDWEYDVTATGTVEITPAGDIFVDWDKTNYAYIVKFNDDVDSGKMEANITDETVTESDDNPHLGYEAGNHSVLRIYSEDIVPIPGHILNITVTYEDRNGDLLEVANRVIEVMGQTTVPKGTVQATYDLSMTSHKNGTDEESWMNISGDATTTYEDDEVNHSFVADDTDVWSTEIDGTSVSTMTGSLTEAVFNSTMLYNEEVFSENSMEQAVEMVTYDGGTYVGSANMTVSQKVVNDLTMAIKYSMIGEMDFFGTMVNMSFVMNDTGEFEEHDNGDGETYDCIKVSSNQTITGVFGLPPILPVDHYAIVNNSISWQARYGENMTNLDIYSEYNSSVYFINDSDNGKWEFLFSEEGQGYIDEDEDGDFNPDPTILDTDQITEFEGVAPRELKVGDRVTTKNEHGAEMSFEVEEIVDKIVGSTTYKAARLNGTYGGIAELTGTVEVYIVAEGEYTGLLLENSETLEFTDADGVVETKNTEMEIKTIG